MGAVNSTSTSRAVIVSTLNMPRARASALVAQVPRCCVDMAPPGPPGDFRPDSAPVTIRPIVGRHTQARLSRPRARLLVSAFAIRLDERGDVSPHPRLRALAPLPPAEQRFYR
jgi:hypothetical protein